MFCRGEARVEENQQGVVKLLGFTTAIYQPRRHRGHVCLGPRGAGASGEGHVSGAVTFEGRKKAGTRKARPSREGVGRWERIP